MPVDFFGPVRSTSLGPSLGLAFQRLESGLVVTSRFIQPVWQGTFNTAPLTRFERAQWLAWLNDCVDRNLRVDFVHPIYAFPLGYSVSNWPDIADPVLLAVDDLRHIRVSGLDAGVTLQKGSRVSIEQDDRICYRSLLSDVVGPNPISQQLFIGPRIPPGIFAPGAIVKFEFPRVRMMVVPDSWEATEDIEDEPLTFDMMETLS